MNRTAHLSRKTTETSVDLTLTLDGSGRYSGSTGVGFFDHMLSHVAKHGRLDLDVQAKGDLHVDEHHLVEDVGICLGSALTTALGERRGIERFGTAYVTMDEALARTIIDLSGRSYFVFLGEFSRDNVSGFPLEMVREFLRAVATEGRMNLHCALLYGRNAHHQVEAIFKSFGRALRAAVALTGTSEVPSTKGVL